MKSIYVPFRKDVLDNFQAMEKTYNIIDTKVDGLYLMIYPKGAKTYNWVRKIKGRRHRIIIGRYANITIDQARGQARKYNATLELSGSPSENLEEAKREPTFSQLYDYYYTEHVIKYTKQPEDNKALTEFHILPLIGHLKASAISTDKLREIHTSIGEKRGKPTANKVMNRISTVFNFAIQNKKIKCPNPTHGIKRYKEYSKDRFLNRIELKAFFEALNQEDEIFRDYFLLLLYTGARKSNVLAMQYIAIDIDLSRWRLTGSESKNDDTNIVLLSEQAMKILKHRFEVNQRLDTPSRYVFPGKGQQGYLCDPKRTWQRVRDRMGVQDITMHDLRRTLGSYMAIKGVSLVKIGKALNHKSQRSTAIYARLSMDPVWEAVNSATHFMDSDTLPSFISNKTTIITKNGGTIKFRSLIV